MTLHNRRNREIDAHTLAMEFQSLIPFCFLGFLSLNYFCIIGYHCDTFLVMYTHTPFDHKHNKNVKIVIVAAGGATDTATIRCAITFQRRKSILKMLCAKSVTTKSKTSISVYSVPLKRKTNHWK